MFMTKLLAHQVTPHHMLDLLVATTSNGEVHKGLNNSSNFTTTMLANLQFGSMQLSTISTMLIRGGENEDDGEARFWVITGLQEFQTP